jgi:alkanesulfonate monooxygenase SsuD/methylene tetrahydromethanopterin reductase-like flavin-dependent oxidoreductase (luciferase family)
MPPLSILDLAFVPEGGTPADTLRNTLDLAQHAERWGYRHFWLAEHHNMVGIASAATAVVIGHVAAGTRTIRVGAGGYEILSETLRDSRLVEALKR